MKNWFLIYAIFIMSACSNKQNCSELIFNKSSRTTFLDNIPYNGICQSFYLDGVLKSKEEYFKGIDHGKWIFYFRDGSIQTQGEFKLGKRIGKWEYFFENGRTWKINYYNNSGNKINVWVEYNMSGELVSKRMY